MSYFNYNVLDGVVLLFAGQCISVTIWGGYLSRKHADVNLVSTAKVCALALPLLLLVQFIFLRGMQGMFTSGMSISTVGFISTAIYFLAVFLTSYIFYKEKTNVRQIFGAIIITLSVLVINIK